MIATLYRPGEPPQSIPADNFQLAGPAGFAKVTEAEAQALGCHVNLVDVLAVGADYVAYSIFDNEGELNLEAMQALAELTGLSFGLGDVDEMLRGNVLVVQHDT
jgi:hypothetical protein